MEKIIILCLTLLLCKISIAAVVPDVIKDEIKIPVEVIKDLSPIEDEAKFIDLAVNKISSSPAEFTGVSTIKESWTSEEEDKNQMELKEQVKELIAEIIDFESKENSTGIEIETENPEDLNDELEKDSDTTIFYINYDDNNDESDAFLSDDISEDKKVSTDEKEQKSSATGIKLLLALLPLIFAVIFM